MALIKITFDSASVTSKEDADVNHYLAAGQNGIIAGLLNACSASTSNNYITFQSGYVQAYGRRVYVESGTKISVSLDGSAYGYVVVKIDIGNNVVTLEKKEKTSGWPTLTQQDLINGGLIYELPLARYTKTTSSLTLDTSYSVPKIQNFDTIATSRAYTQRTYVESEFGPKWQSIGSVSYGTTYIFTNITSSDAPGIGSVYVGGCTVLFDLSAVGGSGGIVYYRYNGSDRSLSMQLTSSGLYIQASDGSTPKYVRVVR
ncbi:MAG: hypothetical protein LKG11_02830 [Bacilli bacterium]|jgi:hypothetical protein|nr:hypothetical protein [Bacilli bacterium]